MDVHCFAVNLVFEVIKHLTQILAIQVSFGGLRQ